jgi:hypothetical protein
LTIDFGHGGNLLKPSLDFIKPLSNIGALPAALALGAESAAAPAAAASACATSNPGIDAIRSAASAQEPAKKPA